MNTQSQSLRKSNLLITGGHSDLAKYLVTVLNEKFKIYSPSRDEMDVTSISSVSNYVLGKNFDVVINAAGTLYSSDVIDSEPEKWIRDINVNLIGTYLVCRALLQKNPKCRILNIASTAGFNCYQDWTSYCASKAGVIKLSGGLFKNGFDVITLCPGAIATKLRNNLKISNQNVMTIHEGCEPIIDALYSKYKSGDVILYRKNNLKVVDYNYHE